MTHKKISFQGNFGAYSDLACREVFPDMETVPCPTFADAFKAVNDGKADLAMIPIDNSTAGRVADIHHLLPNSKLHIIGEFFLPVHHCLLGVKGAKAEDLTHVRSHVHALPQCRNLIEELGVEGIVYGDTARSAQKVAELGDKTQGAIGSSLAAEIYGLDILRQNIEDESHNTTRFIVLSWDAEIPARDENKDYMTSLVFRVRNIPAALYKALGGFATNGVNITKLESYMVGGKFSAAQFYIDCEGHPEDRALRLALEELDFFAKEVTILGTYEAHEFRKK